jgi:hypothetical protein
MNVFAGAIAAKNKIRLQVQESFLAALPGSPFVAAAWHEGSWQFIQNFGFP